MQKNVNFQFKPLFKGIRAQAHIGSYKVTSVLFISIKEGLKPSPTC